MSKDVEVTGVDSEGAAQVFKAMGDGGTIFRLDSGNATMMNREGILRTILNNHTCKFRIVDKLLFNRGNRIITAPILNPVYNTMLYYFAGYTDQEGIAVFDEFRFTKMELMSGKIQSLIKHGMCYNSPQEAKDAFEFFTEIATQKLVVK